MFGDFCGIFSLKTKDPHYVMHFNISLIYPTVQTLFQAFHLLYPTKIKHNYTMVELTCPN